MNRFFRLAQARNLDRIAVAYAVTGWVLVQGASIVFPAFDAPGWALRAFIVVVLIGFPVALAVAWFAAPGAELEDVPVGPVSHREIVLIALLSAVVLFSLGEPFVLLRNPAPKTPAASAGPLETSIAVLPFVNMSGNPSREIFSDGVSEELLNDLSNIASLRVAARTSSFAFKGKNEDIRQIARLLNVRSLLIGSIREDGEQIRISAQLINAADGFQIWSSTYDRQLTGILTLEDEIARAITSALTKKLFGTLPRAGKPDSINPEAYRLYLEGQHELGPRTQDGIAKAVDLFKQVTAMQPDFADGFAALGRALINHADYHPQQKDLLASAQAALKQALKLDPKNLAALAAHLDLAIHRMDWQAATADARRMEAINPNSAIVLHEMFRYYQILGYPYKALAAVRSVVRLNPLSFVDRYNVVAALLHNGQYDEAVSAAHEALALEPNQTEALAMLCTANAASHRLPDARAVLTKLQTFSDATSKSSCDFDIAVAEGRLADARKNTDALALLFPSGDLNEADFGERYAETHDFGKAAQWLSRAYDAKAFTLFTIPYSRSIPTEFLRSPDWKAISSRPLFKDWQAAHDAVASTTVQSR